MNPTEILRIVDAIHRDKNIDPEIVFQAIEAALISAAKKNYGDESEIIISIDRKSGEIQGTHNGEPLDPDETVGRIGAQTAKQVIIQKIREAERDALYDEYEEQIGQMVNGVVQRAEGGTTTVSLGNVEALLPRGEQIPGETHHANERVRATIFEVRKQGSRVKVILSRTRPQLVQRLFEQEIPEIIEGIITVQAMAREPGYRSKVAVSSSDQRVDCVGACVGVRGNRIKNIVDELSGERIDIVRFSDDMQTLIPNALQPAEVDEVILCKMIGRAIVLVHDDQLSLAIGRRGQNVRLASKLCGWDIEIMTREELEEQIERAVGGFSELDGMADELAEILVGEGFLSYDDLSVIEPDDLMSMGGLTAEQTDHIVGQAEKRAEEAEEAATVARKRQRENERIAKATANAETASAEEAGQSSDEQTATAEDATAEVATAEDATAEETTAQETTAQETTAQETTAQETTAQETTAQETTAQETTAQETTAQETTAQETTAQETTAQETTAQETTAQEATAEGSVGEEVPTGSPEASLPPEEGAEAPSDQAEDSSTEESPADDEKKKVTDAVESETA
jgi:N utilization substance protein A